MSERPNTPNNWLAPHRTALLAAVLCLALLALWMALNAGEVSVDFLVASTRLRLAWALLISGALGFGAGALFMWIRRR